MGRFYLGGEASVITGSWDGRLRLYDESDHERPKHLLKECHTSVTEISCVAVSPRLSMAASGNVFGTVTLWDYVLDEPIGTFVVNPPGGTELDPAVRRRQQSRKDRNGPEDVRVGSEIIAMTFCEPYPLLAITDTSGTVSIWLVRPLVVGGVCVLVMPNRAVADDALFSSPAWKREQRRKQRQRVRDDAARIAALEMQHSGRVFAPAPALRDEADDFSEDSDKDHSQDDVEDEEDAMEGNSNTTRSMFETMAGSKASAAAAPFEAEKYKPVTCLAWHRADHLLVTGDAGGRVKVWNLQRVIQDRWLLQPFEDADADSTTQSLPTEAAVTVPQDDLATADGNPVDESGGVFALTTVPISSPTSGVAASEPGSSIKKVSMLGTEQANATRVQHFRGFEAYRLAWPFRQRTQITVDVRHTAGVLRRAVQAGDVCVVQHWETHRGEALRHLEIILDPPTVVRSPCTSSHSMQCLTC
jgi:hypothetical protein